ncbi:MAG: hypothetical protein ACR2J3_12645 [Aridibacter sp.]
MKFTKIIAVGIVILSLTIGGFAQKTLPIVFAVLDDGKTIEPIAYVKDKKLFKTVDGSTPANEKRIFARKYFKNKSKYKLIFAGRNSGVVTVKSSDYKSECSSNTAQVSLGATKTTLKGFVMGLATDFRTTETASGIRRLPTAAERAEFEKIVRDELVKNNVASETAKDLKYHNLTAIDVDNTGIAELVGTFWVETSPTERALIFMIVDKEKSGTYTLTYSDFKSVKKADVMNEEIKSVDDGMLHELLLDSFDYDNDGVGEIFTMVQGFEGSTFNVYKRENGKWVRTFEQANYHCAF